CVSIQYPLMPRSASCRPRGREIRLLLRRSLVGLVVRRSDLGELFAHDGDLLVMEPLLVEPVRACDFPKRIERCLNSFRPGHWDQLDVPMHIANGKDPGTAGLVIRIDGDAAVLLHS